MTSTEVPQILRYRIPCMDNVSEELRLLGGPHSGNAEEYGLNSSHLYSPGSVPEQAGQDLEQPGPVGGWDWMTSKIPSIHSLTFYNSISVVQSALNREEISWA